MHKIKSIIIVVIALMGVLSTSTVTAKEQVNLPDVQYVGYKVVHHMGLAVEHIDNFGFNTFDHPRIAD